jgi:hypothetical protein
MTNDQDAKQIAALNRHIRLQGDALTDAQSAAATWRACAEARAAQLEAAQATIAEMQRREPPWPQYLVRHIQAGEPAPADAPAVVLDAADYAAYRAMHEAMKVITKAAQDGRAITDALLYGTGAPAFPSRALRGGDGVLR